MAGITSYGPNCLPCAAVTLTVSPVTDSSAPGVPATGNLLADVTPPPGASVSVSEVTVAGTNQTVTPGVVTPIYDPTTGALTGTLLVQPDGTYTFDPAPAFTGPVPTLDATVVSTDGQTAVVPLSVSINGFLKDANENPTIVAGTGPLTLNVLANAVAPAGTTDSVASFTLPGSTAVYSAGPTPVPVVDPITGKLTGTVVVLPDGAVTFTPAAGFTGQVPPITYNVASSDGQTQPSTLTIAVQPGAAVVQLCSCTLIGCIKISGPLASSILGENKPCPRPCHACVHTRAHVHACGFANTQVM